jgi:hypothetical protein
LLQKGGCQENMQTRICSVKKHSTYSEVQQLLGCRQLTVTYALSSAESNYSIKNQLYEAAAASYNKKIEFVSHYINQHQRTSQFPAVSQQLQNFAAHVINAKFLSYMAFCAKSHDNFTTLAIVQMHNKTDIKASVNCSHDS